MATKTKTTRIVELMIALEEIRDLASWHYDPEADPENQSPEDNVAHINGLIVKICNKELEGIE